MPFGPFFYPPPPLKVKEANLQNKSHIRTSGQASEGQTNIVLDIYITKSSYQQRRASCLEMDPFNLLQLDLLR